MRFTIKKTSPFVTNIFCMELKALLFTAFHLDHLVFVMYGLIFVPLETECEVLNWNQCFKKKKFEFKKRNLKPNALVFK